ncbi:DUF6493 family protein [Nonomuraea jiangxiensis]|uniref:DUF7824 domain-containing protein n=1 Tax=Nonomuraea jiangxiensis TaxID=633440 RepID=A0A1G9MKA7_9ACTN|nr:DUF6493 family protein [Nonomuraea jiangxiensis]SDL74649.1 hypothetical protein SAMN05421869_13039 [Nonomuraea jiangxiensis]
MTPWDEVLERIEAEDDQRLAEFLNGLGDADRRMVAGQLAGHLATRLGGASRRQVMTRPGEPVTGYRLAGAACLGGAAQVAAWLNRRELRRVRDEAADAALVMSVLRRRPPEWRQDLAVRLVQRLRPPAGGIWRRLRGEPGWQLAAALVIETGVAPPESDAFVAGWAWRAAARHRENGGRPVLDGDPLLDHLLPRLFQAQGVAEALVADEDESRRQQREASPGGPAHDPRSCLSIAGELAALAAAGRLPRRTLVDGCASRFLVGGEDAEIAPFVTLWRLLETSVAEIPVLDFVRLLPSADSPLVRLVVDELRRAEAAGALPDALFAEAVGALAFRPERKYVTAAIQWLAAVSPSRGGGAVAALAHVFDGDLPALWDPAVRLAVKLAPHADEAARDTIREAAGRLPDEPRERLAAAYGTVPAATQPEPPAAAKLIAPPPPVLAPPLTSAAELAAELTGLRWPEDPSQYERILAAMVELAHRDREEVVALLAPMWRGHWGHPDNPLPHAYLSNDRTTHALLSRCVLALAYPDYSRRLTTALAERADPAYPDAVLPHRLVLRRIREIIHLFERGATLPVLLATPTAATGHLDPETLLDRMERLGDVEPLEADFQQALLRLPRQVDTALLVRAEKLPTRAGRRLADWLRDGGLPDPEVRCEVGQPYGINPDFTLGVWASTAAPDGLPDWLRELCSARPANGYAAYPDDVVWWPAILPSHRELVAAYMVQVLPWLARRGGSRVDAVVALAHGEGPVGRATAVSIAACLAHPRPVQRAAAADALTVLAVRGQLPAADLGWAVAHLVRVGAVSLRQITAALADLVAAGAHAEVCRALTTAVPLLLPAAGEKTRSGLGELLSVAVQAAVLTGTRAEIPGLAELAARKGSSLVLQEARRLHRTISP